jgi:hypothetical protein
VEWKRGEALGGLRLAESARMDERGGRRVFSSRLRPLPRTLVSRHEQRRNAHRGRSSRAAPVSPAPALPALPFAPLPRHTPSLAHAEPAVLAESATISVLHWGRLLDRELFAASSDVPWAVLMRRTWGSMF